MIPARSFIRKIFRYPKLSKHWRVPLQNFSSLRQKCWTENHDTPSTPPPFLFINFFGIKKFGKHRIVPYEVFRHWDKKVLTENRDTPSLFFNHKLRYPWLSNTRNGLLQNFLVLLDKQISTENCDLSLLSKNFSSPKNSDTLKDSSAKYFGKVEHINFDAKSWFLTPLLSVIVSDTETFLKHRRVPLQKFSALWDKKFSTKVRDITLLS